MKKQPSNLSRLMQYAGSHRYLTYASWILSAGSALLAVACQAKRKKVTRKTQKTALIYPIYGNQSGFSYVI